MGARDIHNYVSTVFERRKRKNRATKEEEKVMSIEDATNNLKNNNQGGLDRRLLLPSVEAKEAAANTENQGLGSLKSEILRLTATVSDKNDLIIDQLIELNSQIRDGKFGGGERENMLQTALRTPGRMLRGGVKMGQSALKTGTDLLMSPLNLIRSAGSSALGAVTAAPKALGNMVGNLFQSKSMKGLVDVNQKQLTEQTAIKDSVEDIAKDVADIAKMMEQELKIKRRGRLDALEAQRDARDNKPGLIGASRVGGGTRATTNLRNRPPKSPDGVKPGIIGAVTSSVSNFITNPIGAAATALGGASLFRRFRNRNNVVPGASAPTTRANTNIGPNPRPPTLLERAKGLGSRAAGVAKRAVPGAATALGIFELGKTFIDREATFADKMEETAGATGGIVGGVAGAKTGALGGAALGAALGSVVPILGTAAGGAIGGAIGAIGGGLLGYAGGDFAGRFLGSQQFRDRRRVENIEKEKFNSPEEAAQVAEQLGIDDYEIVQQERRTFFAKKKMIYRIKPVEPNPTADLENMPSPTDGTVGPVETMMRQRVADRSVDETDVPVIELKITPNLNTQTIQEMFDAAIDKHLREKNILLDNQEQMLNTDQSPQSSINITPISDNRASNVNNNITTLNKVALSSIDQTNKVVPI